MTDTPKAHPAIDAVADLLKKASDRVRGVTLTESDKSVLDEIVKNAKGFFDSVRVVHDPEPEQEKEEFSTPNPRTVILNEKSRTYIYTAGSAGVKIHDPYSLEVTSSGAHIVRSDTGAETIFQPGWIALQIEPNS